MPGYARFVARVLVSVLLLSWPASSSAQPVCGDGVVTTEETCDPPGSAVPNDAAICRADCTFCGDGIINGLEACDVGARGDCGSCTKECFYRILDFRGDGGCPCGFDDPDLVDLRNDIVTACACATAASHGAFLRCARARLQDVGTDRVLPGCWKSALKCLARSVCGKPGAVTCCRTNAHGARTCSIKPSPDKCTAAAGGSAVLGVGESCCDACR